MRLPARQNVAALSHSFNYFASHRLHEARHASWSPSFHKFWPLITATIFDYVFYLVLTRHILRLLIDDT